MSRSASLPTLDLKLDAISAARGNEGRGSAWPPRARVVTSPSQRISRVAGSCGISWQKFECLPVQLERRTCDVAARFAPDLRPDRIQPDRLPPPVTIRMTARSASAARLGIDQGVWNRDCRPGGHTEKNSLLGRGPPCHRVETYFQIASMVGSRGLIGSGLGCWAIQVSTWLSLSLFPTPLFERYNVGRFEPTKAAPPRCCRKEVALLLREGELAKEVLVGLVSPI